MKSEFELTIDEKTGEPKIIFKHHDKSSHLHQKLLKRFVTKAKEKGIILVSPNSYCQVGSGNSWDNYEIRISNE